MAGFAVFVGLLVSLHFIQPELDPLTRFGSEYARGRLGWLMKLAFFGFATGLGALAYTIGHSIGPPTRSRAAGILLALAALGIAGSGLFDADLQGSSPTREGIFHDLAGFLTFLSLLPAMFVVSSRLAGAGLLHGPYRLLRMLPWLATVLFLTMLFLFGPVGLVGLGQRLFLAAVFTWLLTVAAGLRAERFSISADEPGESDGAAPVSMR